MTLSRRAMLLHAFAGFAAFLCGRVPGAHAASPAAGQARIIRIEAKRFAYTPNEITVRQGEQVMLELTAIDFVHGFNLPDFKIRTDIRPGMPTRLPLRPTTAGRYTFLCDNFCGGGHESMNGTLIVEA